MNFYDEMYALVKEMDDKIGQLEQVGATALRQLFSGEIPNNLGTVTVGGDGRLLSVDLNTRRLPYLDGATVGRAVLAAVQETSARAVQNTFDTVAAARQQITI